MQPLGTSTPVLFEGHTTGSQELLKNGAIFVAETNPSKPALHEQPAATVPTISSVDVVVEVVARAVVRVVLRAAVLAVRVVVVDTGPLRDFKCAGSLFIGQGTAKQLEEKNGATDSAETLPEWPWLHIQPLEALAPALFAGQGTAAQELE